METRDNRDKFIEVIDKIRSHIGKINSRESATSYSLLKNMLPIAQNEPDHRKKFLMNKGGFNIDNFYNSYTYGQVFSSQSMIILSKTVEITWASYIYRAPTNVDKICPDLYKTSIYSNLGIINAAILWNLI